MGNFIRVKRTTIDLRRNIILGCLPEHELARLAADLTVVRNGRLDHVHEEGSPLEEVYFPLDAVFSVVEAPDRSAGIEVTMIGNDGVVGLQVFLEARTCINTILCQVPGCSAQLGVTQLHDAISHGGRLSQLFRRYAQVTIMQLARNAACNCVHSARQRASRWLLSIRDRVGRDHFPLTHKLFAQMLGVRRATVTVTVGELQRYGLIRYQRGWVEVIDHLGLEQAACECYRIVRERSHSLLGTESGACDSAPAGARKPATLRDLRIFVDGSVESATWADHYISGFGLGECS